MDALAAQTYMQTQLHVSRETMEHLTRYAELLVRWQNAINLVSADTLPHMWTRHILDSAQLLPHLEDLSREHHQGQALRIMDMGSGAGFPGMVLAVASPHMITLVESDGRKVAFLREVNRLCAAKATIQHRRLEALPQGEDGQPAPRYDCITARACADIAALIAYAAPQLAPDGVMVLLKGKRWEEELRAAEANWRFTFTHAKSITEDTGVVLTLRAITPRAP